MGKPNQRTVRCGGREPPVHPLPVVLGRNERTGAGRSCQARRAVQRARIIVGAVPGRSGGPASTGFTLPLSARSSFRRFQKTAGCCTAPASRGAPARYCSAPWRSFIRWKRRRHLRAESTLPHGESRAAAFADSSSPSVGWPSTTPWPACRGFAAFQRSVMPGLGMSPVRMTFST